jgi:hypothetical protein
MSAGATIICKKCRQKIPLDRVRYDQNGRDLICLDCYDKLQWAMKKAGFAERKDPSPSVRLTPPKEKPVQKPKAQVDKQKYICMNCRYKFSLRKDGEHVKRCPYCGKDNLEEDNFNIHKLIEESDLPE